MLSELKISTPFKEGDVSYSHWSRHPILISQDEIQDLFYILRPFSLFNVSSIENLSDLEVSIEKFIENYTLLLEALKKPVLIIDPFLKRFLCCALTTDFEAVYAFQVKPDRYVIKSCKPLIQIQLYLFSFNSSMDQIQPMGSAPHSIYWGIQLSYPKLFSSSLDGSYYKVNNPVKFPNTATFISLIRWIRKFTAPVTFVHQEKKIPTCLRLGFECYKWIHFHSQLKNLGVRIYK